MQNQTSPDVDTGRLPGFVPRILEGGLMLDIERLTQTMAILEDYVDSMLALEDDLMPADPRIDEEEIQLRVASL